MGLCVSVRVCTSKKLQPLYKRQGEALIFVLYAVASEMADSSVDTVDVQKLEARLQSFESLQLKIDPESATTKGIYANAKEYLSKKYKKLFSSGKGKIAVLCNIFNNSLFQ